VVLGRFAELLRVLEKRGALGLAGAAAVRRRALESVPERSGIQAACYFSAGGDGTCPVQNGAAKRLGASGSRVDVVSDGEWNCGEVAHFQAGRAKRTFTRAVGQGWLANTVRASGGLQVITFQQSAQALLAESKHIVVTGGAGDHKKQTLPGVHTADGVRGRKLCIASASIGFCQHAGRNGTVFAAPTERRLNP
jgi:hypothetical protein